MHYRIYWTNLVQYCQVFFFSGYASTADGEGGIQMGPILCALTGIVPFPPAYSGSLLVLLLLDDGASASATSAVRPAAT
jgi:hypothetical protein